MAGAMRFRRRLRTRIVLSFLLLGFGLTTLFAASTWLLRAHMENDLIEARLQRDVDSLNQQVRSNPGEPASSRLLDGFSWSPRTLYKAPLAWQQLDSGVYDFSEVDENGERREYKLAVRRTPEVISFVRYDTTGASVDVRQLATLLVGAIVLFTLLAWFVGVKSSHRVMHPVAALAEKIRAYRGTELPERLAPQFADDEVGELASVLDDYADRLNERVQRDREFNADVSHELRTPLAVIRGAVELMLSRPDLDEKTRSRLLRIERATLQSTHLTTALLMLSRSERGAGNTDLHKLAEQLAEAGRAQLGGKPVRVRVEGRDDVFVNAPEAVLAVALGNLVGNACKYTAEGEVRIIVEGDRVRIVDTGPGLSAEDAARLFERGYRGSGAGGTSGGGIGLSIVRRLCELYGWSVYVTPGAQGGAEAVLVFG